MLRTRLLVLVSVVVASTVAVVTFVVSVSARRAFERLDVQRTTALVAQLRRELTRTGEDVARRIDAVAGSDEFRRIATELATGRAEASTFVNDAASLASARGLDVLDIVADDGRIISSAHWPARFGYPHPWGLAPRKGAPYEGAPPKPSLADDSADAFLQPIEGPDGVALGLVAIREVTIGGRRVRLAGGMRLDREFLGTLQLPSGTRALLYRNLQLEASHQQLIDTSGTIAQATELEPLIARVREGGEEASETIEWPDGSETVHAIPLRDRDTRIVAMLLLGSSGRELDALVQRIQWSGVGFGALGIAVGVALAYAVAARVTEPIERLAAGARAVSGGDWGVQLDVRATGEVADLAEAFNAMTRQLADQRERLVQAERVAAWRELARRLAHELKNPLFPLRLTLDNLRRAKADHPAEFEEVFEEGMGTLATGLANLNAVIAKFSDFARMPPPQFEAARLNDVVRQSTKLFEAQLGAPDRPRVAMTLELDDAVGAIRMDPEQIGRALQNLLLNAIDAMPGGGTLTIRTRKAGAAALIEVSDTGDGLIEEERERLFTPYYTTKQYGTGLGLAIVQSVITDHKGRIQVESVKNRGTTFLIELPADR